MILDIASFEHRVYHEDVRGPTSCSAVKHHCEENGWAKTERFVQSPDFYPIIDNALGGCTKTFRNECVRLTETPIDSCEWNRVVEAWNVY